MTGWRAWCATRSRFSPTAFVKQVNRATAETSQDSADAEGLAPLMRWVKDCIDRLLSEDFAAPDLEFAWVAEAAQDPLEQAQIDQIYVSAGIKTINEVRAISASPQSQAATRRWWSCPAYRRSPAKGLQWRAMMCSGWIK